jgi:hypothetical protein
MTSYAGMPNKNIRLEKCLEIDHSNAYYKAELKNKLDFDAVLL